MEIFGYLLSMLASYFISAIMRPSPENARPAAFDDFGFPQADEGTPQTVVFGDVRVSDWMVLGIGNYRTEAIKVKNGK